MSSVSASIKVSAPAPVVYRYLRERYAREAYRSTSIATKGYVPAVTCIEEVENRRMAFRVQGRDPLLRDFLGSWTWAYEIEPMGDSSTQVIIRYTWSWLMSLLGVGTIRPQACNEITEAAMALDALAWGHVGPATNS